MKSRRFIRLISLMLCLSMIFGIMLPAAAAWDGYDVEVSDDGRREIKLIDANRVNDVLTARAFVSENAAPGDKFSMRWKNINSPTSLAFYRVPRDLSDVNSFRISIYTEKPTNATIAIRFLTDTFENKPNVSPYYYVTATTNHTGWKEFVFLKSDFTEYYATGWDKIRYVSLVSGDRTGIVDDVNFCISSLYGDITETEPDLKLGTTKEEKDAVFKVLGNNIAIMNYSNNVIKNGAIKPVNVEDRITTDINGDKIAKFGLFSNVLGGAVNDENGRVTVTLDGRTADVTEHIVTYDDEKYLKLNLTLEALGKTVNSYDLVTIIGDKEAANKIFSDEELLEDLEYMLNERLLSAEDITQEDWDLVKKQWREYLVGRPEDTDTPEQQAAIKALEKECEKLLGTINKNPKVWAFFGTKSLAESNDAIDHSYKIKTLAKAYATYGCKYYQDPNLLRIALRALDWFTENAYTTKELMGQGLSTKSAGDWNVLVGIPMELTEILVLLGDGVSLDLVEKYLYVYENCKYNVSGQGGRVHAATLSAILHQDYDELVKRNEDYIYYMHPRLYDAEEVLRKGIINSGIKQDWAYVTHHFYAYSSAYGCTTLLDRLVTVESILMGTKFEFVNPYKYDPVMWMRETFGPIIFNGAITSAQSGRFRNSDMFSEERFVRYVAASALDLIGCFGKDDDEFLKQFIKRIVVKENRKTVEDFLNSYQLRLLGKIMDDESIVAKPYYKSKMYYSVDSAIHQKDDFGFALAMSSSRIGGWESIDAANIDGWYQGDGALYTYLKDDVLQYNRQYWKYVNPYHLAGTTVDTQPRIPASIGDSKRTRTSQHFVGGVQFDEDYTVAAMQLEGHKNDNPGAVVTIDKSGPSPSHYSSLLAKKAWFFFDDEAVAVGSDINANDGFEVQTVIENRKLNITKTIDQASANDESKGYKIIKASGPSSDENPPENSIDDDMLSYWAAEGDAIYTWEMEKTAPIGFIGIAQNGGVDGKQAIFELEVSTDGENWTQVFAGKASGKTRDMEAYSAGGKQAKFVRYVGHGRTNSKWNSITEIRFFPPTADGKPPVDGLIKYAEANSQDYGKGKILGAENIIVDGALLEKESNYTKEFKNPKWAHIENVGGYYFPTGGDLKMDKVTNNKYNFLEMWFTHGVNPQTGNYAYVLLPTKTVEETEKYTKSPDIEILSNTKELQVVREKTLGITGLVFWEAGKYENIETSVPMIMMTKDKTQDGIYRISLSDPTKLLKEGKVTLKGNYELLEGDKRFTVVSKNNETVISINFKGAEGKSLSISLLAK